MTKEVNGIIILDNGVSVLPIFDSFCPKCKKNLSPDSNCYQCRDFSYELVISLGYYYSRWYKKDDRYIKSGLNWSFELNDVNPRYRFSKLINDAKQRCRFNTIPERKQIINILSNGLAWKIKKNYSWILNEIEFIVHVPKKEEDPSRDDNNPRYFNHGYYYAEYISRELKIPFIDYLIYEYEDSKRKNRKFGISEFRDVKNSTVLLIDDVYTNGDTKGSIANILKNSGAMKIYIGVIGRSVFE